MILKVVIVAIITFAAIVASELLYPVVEQTDDDLEKQLQGKQMTKK